MKKNRHRIRNWSDYNRSLTNRGSLTFWISRDLIGNWIEQEKTGMRGSSPKYTDAAITATAQIKFVFHQAQGQSKMEAGKQLSSAQQSRNGSIQI